MKACVVNTIFSFLKRRHKECMKSDKATIFSGLRAGNNNELSLESEIGKVIHPDGSCKKTLNLEQATQICSRKCVV